MLLGALEAWKQWKHGGAVTEVERHVVGPPVRPGCQTGRWVERSRPFTWLSGIQRDAVSRNLTDTDRASLGCEFDDLFLELELREERGVSGSLFDLAMWPKSERGCQRAAPGGAEKGREGCELLRAWKSDVPFIKRVSGEYWNKRRPLTDWNSMPPMMTWYERISMPSLVVLALKASVLPATTSVRLRLRNDCK